MTEETESCTRDNKLVVIAGESYLLDVKGFRKTQPEYYAKKSAIEVLREQAKLYLDDFLQQAREKGLTVCIIIHGFNSNHEANSIKDHVGQLAALNDKNKIVRLYIDWDSQTTTKASLLLLQGNSRIITNGIENAHDIQTMLRKAIRKHVKRFSEDDKNENKDKLSILVLAHSMGAHVAEAFIKEHELINLRAVIYFNPHADHTFYNLQHVPSMYMNRYQEKGFVLVFASAHDLVLSSSNLLQKFVRNVLRTILPFKNSYIRPLGISWENYRQKATKCKHRVVVLHMKRSAGWFYRTWCDIMRHSSYRYQACKDISNAAIRLAMTEESFDITQVLDLVEDKHCLKDDSGIIQKPHGPEEYVDYEVETDKTIIDLHTMDARIKKMPPKELVVNETTPLTSAIS